MGSVCKLAARRKKKYFKKRVGSASDAWNANVVIEDETERKRKGSMPQNSKTTIRKKRKELEKEDEDGHRPSDV